MTPSILQLLKDISAERDVRNRTVEIQEAKKLGLIQKGLVYFRPWILTSSGCNEVNKYFLQTSMQRGSKNERLQHFQEIQKRTKK